MSKYKKCPHCKHKNLATAGICSKCNRLLDTPKEFDTKPSENINQEKSIIPAFIRLFIFFLILVLVIIYFNKDYKIVKTDPNDTYKEESFLDKIDTIFYNSSYSDNKLIPVKDYSDDEPFKLINKNGQVLMDKIINYVADYNTFHVITKKNNKTILYYLVDNEGKELYKSKNKIIFYPATNSWVIGDKLYHDHKMIKDNIKMDGSIYYNGYYFSYVDDEEQGIINYEGNIGYTNKTKEYNHFVLETNNIIKPDRNNYCVINDNYNYLIANCLSGEIKFDNKNEKIYEIATNIYYLNNSIVYINNNGDLVLYNTDSNKKDIYAEYLDDNKVLIDKFIYDDNTDEKEAINDLDLHSLYFKEIESNLNIQKEYCLNMNQLNYGLKYNDIEVIPCNYSDISYFNSKIMYYLNGNQKIYVIIRNNRQNQLFDVKNGTVLLDSVIDYSTSSVFLKYKEENKNYIYNIITDEKIEIPNDSYVELHSNYFMLEKYKKDKTTTNREYYNTEFKNIYLGK